MVDVRRVRVIVLDRFMCVHVGMSLVYALRSLMRVVVVFVMGVTVVMPKKSVCMPMLVILLQQEYRAEKHQGHGGEEWPLRQFQEHE